MDRLHKLREDPDAQALTIARCAGDIHFFVNEFCWTYDPRESPSTLPFLLFPRQEEFLDWLAERERLQENGVAVKCRDVGFTWLCAVYAEHKWLFRDEFRCGFGSRKLELVDTIGDPKCVFEKIRQGLRTLPRWMLPPGFSFKQHDNYCKLINPATGSTISGEGGDDIGRGDRSTMYFVDEAAFLEHPQSVDAALSQTTRCRIDVSTPNGPGNSFATKVHGGKFSVFRFDWRDDPRKDAAWYEKQKSILDPVILAQEVDMDFNASIEGVTIPAQWVRAAVDLDLDAFGPVVAGMDISGGGKNRTVLQPRQGPVLRMPIDWAPSGPTRAGHDAIDLAEEHRIGTINYDVSGLGLSVQELFATTERRLGFVPIAINGGAPPSEALWPDGRTAREIFYNRRAELYWMLRKRFEKSYEFKTLNILHPKDEMISIPNHPKLIAELSLPLNFKTNTGKILIESKEDMRKRGIASPDFADAAAYSEAGAAADWTEAAAALKENVPESGSSAFGGGLW